MSADRILRQLNQQQDQTRQAYERQRADELDPTESPVSIEPFIGRNADTGQIVTTETSAPSVNNGAIPPGSNALVTTDASGESVIDSMPAPQPRPEESVYIPTPENFAVASYVLELTYEKEVARACASPETTCAILFSKKKTVGQPVDHACPRYYFDGNFCCPTADPSAPYATASLCQRDNPILEDVPGNSGGTIPPPGDGWILKSVRAFTGYGPIVRTKWEFRGKREPTRARYESFTAEYTTSSTSVNGRSVSNSTDEITYDRPIIPSPNSANVRNRVGMVLSWEDTEVLDRSVSKRYFNPNTGESYSSSSYEVLGTRRATQSARLSALGSITYRDKDGVLRPGMLAWTGTGTSSGAGGEESYGSLTGFARETSPEVKDPDDRATEIWLGGDRKFAIKIATLQQEDEFEAYVTRTGRGVLVEIKHGREIDEATGEERWCKVKSWQEGGRSTNWQEPQAKDKRLETPESEIDNACIRGELNSVTANFVLTEYSPDKFKIDINPSQIVSGYGGTNRALDTELLQLPPSTIPEEQKKVAAQLSVNSIYSDNTACELSPTATFPVDIWRLVYEGDAPVSDDPYAPAELEILAYSPYFALPDSEVLGEVQEEPDPNEPIEAHRLIFAWSDRPEDPVYLEPLEIDSRDKYELYLSQFQDFAVVGVKIGRQAGGENWCKIWVFRIDRATNEVESAEYAFAEEVEAITDENWQRWAKHWEVELGAGAGEFRLAAEQLRDYHLDREIPNANLQIEEELVSVLAVSEEHAIADLGLEEIEAVVRSFEMTPGQTIAEFPYGEPVSEIELSIAPLEIPFAQRQVARVVAASAWALLEF